MAKEEIVYWGVHQNIPQAIHAELPDTALKSILAGKTADALSFPHCPAFRDTFANVFAVKSWFDYKLEIVDGKLMTDDYGADFYRQLIVNHATNERVWGMGQLQIFIAESDSLKMTQEHPALTRTGWANSVQVIPGTIDIGKYARTLECGFYALPDTKVIDLKRGDPLYFARFHTDSKIKIVPFLYTDRMEEILRGTAIRARGKRHTPLATYYEAFKRHRLKSLVLREVKANVG